MSTQAVDEWGAILTAYRQKRSLIQPFLDAVIASRKYGYPVFRDVQCVSEDDGVRKAAHLLLHLCGLGVSDACAELAPTRASALWKDAMYVYSNTLPVSPVQD